MALAITNRGSGNHNSSATSFTLSPGSNFTAGASAVLCVAADNSSTGGTTNNFTTVTDTLNNTWTLRQSPVFDNGAASAGVQGAIYTCEQNIGTLQTGTVITVNFGAATVAKTWTLTEVAPASGKVAEFRTGGNKSAGATGTAMTMGASATVNVGEVIVAAFFIEGGTSNSISTPDADATNGTWTTNQYNEIGTTVAGSCIVSQAKLQTTTNSTQSYDVTAAVSNDYHGSYVILKELARLTASLAADGGGTADIAASTRTLVTSMAADGGGSAIVSASTRILLTAIAADGGSSAIVDATVIPSGPTEHTTSIAADGGGEATIAGSTRVLVASVSADGASSSVVGNPLRTAFAALASDGGGSADIAAATRIALTAVAADGASTIAADATVSGPAPTEHFTSVAADGGGAAVIAGATRTAASSLAASGAGTIAVVDLSRTMFSSLVATAGGDASIVTSLSTFTSLSASAVSAAIIADATVIQPGVTVHEATVNADGACYVGVHRVTHATHRPVKGRTLSRRSGGTWPGGRRRR